MAWDLSNNCLKLIYQRKTGFTCVIPVLRCYTSFSQDKPVYQVLSRLVKNQFYSMIYQFNATAVIVVYDSFILIQLLNLNEMNNVI